MSGNPEKASIWGDADVYIGELDATNPETIDDPFDASWGLVGLLDGDAGFEESRSMDTSDYFAWGGLLIRTSRRNFVLTRKFTALEDNLVVAGIVWPGSGPAERVVPNLQHRFKIAFETHDGARSKRAITPLYAQVDEIGTIKDAESELTKYEVTVKIYPTGEGKLFDIQPPDGDVATLVSVGVTPATKSLAVGEYSPLTLTATYSDDTTRDVSNLAKWATSAASKALVDGKFVRGVAAGTANVTGTYLGQSATCAVTVA
jgi:hypothetical protein